MTKISIIVPVYNSEKHLETCINSILQQSFRNLEIIIIDDGSSDNSGIICDNYLATDKRIKVIHHKINSGVTCARKTGITNATGEYIAFIDSDDTINSNYIEQLINNVNSELLIYGTNHISTTKKTSNSEYIKGLLCDYYDWRLPGKLYHISLLQNNIMTTPRNINIGEDLIENIKIARRVNNILFVPCNGYNYLTNLESVTHTRQWSLKYEELFMKTVEEVLDIDKPLYIKELWIFKVHCWKNMILHNIKVNRNKEWVQWLLKNKPDKISMGIGDKIVFYISNHYLAMHSLKFVNLIKQIKNKIIL